MAKILCREGDIPEDGAIGLDDNRLVAVRRDGKIYLYRNVCPHQGTPLNMLPDEFMDAGGGLLLCHTHGASFLPDSGLCVSGPCPGLSLEPVRWRAEGGHIVLAEEAGA